MNLDLAVQLNCQNIDTPDEAQLRNWVSAVLCNHGDDDDEAEIAIRIVDEDESRMLNSRYRAKDKPTNVLSFQASMPDGVELPLLGDILICAPIVAREASEQGIDPEAHWAHMVVHGTLHLLGYDHQDDVQADAMECREVEILCELGYSNPYKAD